MHKPGLSVHTIVVTALICSCITAILSALLLLLLSITPKRRNIRLVFSLSL